MRSNTRPTHTPTPACRRALIASTLVILVAGLAACTTMPSSRLAQQVAPMQRVWVVASLGSFSGSDPAGAGARRPGGEVSAAMRSDFPETLRRNGVPVSGYLEQARPLQNVEALKALWAEHRAALAPTSHVLVLTAQRLLTDGMARRVEYEAVLWDTSGETLAWKGTPSFLMNRAGRHRTAEGEVLAGDLLRAFQRDGLLALAKGYPVDAAGAEIPQEWLGVRLY
jgi:hypothetical protein